MPRAMVLVRDRMKSPPITVDEGASLEEIARLFEARSISAAPVLSKGRLVGVVSTTDVLRALTAGHDEAARRLVAGRVHRLVVVEGDRAVGVLSAPDILAEGVSRNIKDPIRSIVSQPVETIDLGESIQAAVTRLADANVHGLVVVDRGAPVGVFTHREAIAARRLAPMLRGQPVEHAMSYQVVCLDIDTPISRAVAYGTSMNVRRFVATEDGRPAGIVSCIDLVDVLARAPEATGAA